MTKVGGRPSLIAEALAAAYLAGEWDPGAMGRRGKRALGDRRKWITDLAQVARSGFPDAPTDRPRELAAFLAECALFRRALHDPDRPLRVHRWMFPLSAMGASRWPVPAIADRAVLAAWLTVTPDHLAWFADR